MQDDTPDAPGDAFDADFDRFTRELAECEVIGVAAFGRLMPRRKELGALMTAAARGDLIGRPLAATERDVIRDALCFAYHVACRDELARAFGNADA
ncbi:MAG: hypothetical protein H0T47_17875 [Planctomycetaceae bacterium]|nr:hypothetical protein [Planctomycetaceae bacterium]